MHPTDRDRLASVLNTPTSEARKVHGGYTPAERWSVVLADGRRVFAKIGPTPFTATALRSEHGAYRILADVQAPFAPRLLAFDDHAERPLLVLEDLSHARWPPPWTDDDLEAVQSVFDPIEACPGPWPDLDLTPMTTSWQQIAHDPSAFLSTGLCSEAWLRHALPTLQRAEATASTAHDGLLHQDLRSDNLCLVDGPSPTVRVVDWNFAGRGPTGLDRAFMAPSLRLEGGPLPERFAPHADAHTAWVAGFFAARAGLPQIPDAPRVRRFQHRQLRIALPWAARVLGLPPPDGDWARRALGAHDEALDRGDLETTGWHRRVEEDLVDAYLTTDDPHAGAGKSGDAVDWRWSRELILDALPPDGRTVLDVGCANGHLIDSLTRWGDERGLSLEVHGLEISERLAAVARRRLPTHADRIHVGNVADWAPPRRYDLVHTGLDYVPPHQRADLVARIRRDLLCPGGRLVLRPERVSEGEPDPVQQLRDLGLRPDGVLEATHPRTGAVRRTVWLSAR